jgi:hypothetical protein
MVGRLIQEQKSSKLLTESFNTYACTGEVMCSRLFGLLGHKSLNSTPCHLTKGYGIAFCFYLGFSCLGLNGSEPAESNGGPANQFRLCLVQNVGESRVLMSYGNFKDYYVPSFLDCTTCNE